MPAKVNGARDALATLQQIRQNQGSLFLGTWPGRQRLLWVLQRPLTAQKRVVMYHFRSVRGLTLFVALAVLLGAMPALAVVPSTSSVEGVLTTASGGPAADGNYVLSFAILDAQAGKAVWSEGPVNVASKGGLFGYALGSATPLTAGVLSGDRWLQVQVGADPALPTIPLRSSLFALRAGVADTIECSACIKPAMVDTTVLQPFAKTTDLQSYAKTTDLGDYVKAAALAPVAGTGSYKDLKDLPKLADVASSGQYGDLQGLPVLAKVGTTCGTGLLLRGIKADGSYECIQQIESSLLPPDGLDSVSNNALTAEFVEGVGSSKAIDIADALPAGVSDALAVPDYGVAQSVSVAVELTNSDISKVRITLYDPTGAAYKVYDQGGSGTSLKGTWPSPNALVSGDLSTWVGKNPSGTWSINVADLTGTTGKLDGQLVSWSIKVGTLSSKKVKANVAFILANATKDPFPCDSTVFGAQYANPADKAIYVCNGTSWFPILLTAYGAKEAPAINCKDLLTKSPLTKSGMYWVDPDGGGQGDPAYQVYCDMTTDGGGWTLVWSNLRGGTSKPMTNMTWAAATATLPIFFKGLPSDNLEAWGVYTGIKRWAQLGNAQLRYSWSSDFGAGIQQSYRCNYGLNASTNYAISFSACTQLVGSVAPGLVTYHNSQQFSTFDADHDNWGGNCSTSYSGSPFWYTSCWDGNINGGGEGGNGYQNAAYWSGSAASTGAANGTGGGNGWIFIR